MTVEVDLVEGRVLSISAIDGAEVVPMKDVAAGLRRAADNVERTCLRLLGENNHLTGCAQL